MTDQLGECWEERETPHSEFLGCAKILKQEWAWASRKSSRKVVPEMEGLALVPGEVTENVQNSWGHLGAPQRATQGQVVTLRGALKE